MELWDLYDAERCLTGKTMQRGEPMPEGMYHLVVHVCIFNSKGEMLIQQRQPFKRGWSNLWDITMGGSAVQGDSSWQAAEREVQEELGLTIHLQGVRPHMSVNFDHGFDDFYLIQQDVDLDQLRLQPEEVQAVRWATKEDILAMIEAGTFIPYYPNLIGLLFDCRTRYSSHMYADPTKQSIIPKSV